MHVKKIEAVCCKQRDLYKNTLQGVLFILAGVFVVEQFVSLSGTQTVCM